MASRIWRRSVWRSATAPERVTDRLAYVPRGAWEYLGVIVVFVLAALAVVTAVALLLTRGTQLLSDDPPPQQFAWPPAAGIDGPAVAGARFTIALRGYQMSQVDAVLRDCALALAQRDSQIAELRAQGIAQGDDAR